MSDLLNLFEHFFKLRQSLDTCTNIANIPDVLSNNLNQIQTLDGNLKQNIQDTIFNTVKFQHNQYTKLQELTDDCLQHVGAKKPAHAVLNKLQTILKQENLTVKEKTDNFFKYLHSDDNKNLNILKQDNSRSTKKFLQGIAVIAAIVCTGILPGLAIAGIAYAANKGSVFDFFKPKAQEFTEQIEQSKIRPLSSGA